MLQRARAGAFLTTLLLLTAIFGTYCATAAAEEDSWDTSGMSFGFGGRYVYDESSDSEHLLRLVRTSQYPEGLER